ncbi:hypothetical protein [Neisseria sp.]
MPLNDVFQTAFPTDAHSSRCLIINSTGRPSEKPFQTACLCFEQLFIHW